ncbi:MAG: stage III sporulation protein AE [Clostridia bacterium]|nr:stage III sporulation protein AE [Clostridia bacterium]
MKKAAAIFFCMLVFWIPAGAEDLFSDQQAAGQASMWGALDGESQNLLNGISADSDFAQNLFTLLHRTQEEQSGAVHSAAATLMRVAIVLILCSCAGSFSKTSHISPLVLSLVGALGITAVVYENLSGMIGLCTETAEEIRVFSKSMLPVMMTAVSLTGAPATAAVVYSGTMFALDLCISLITGVFIPAVSAYVAIITVNTAIGNDMLTRLAAFLKWLITGTLKLLLTLFFFYITISGSVSHGLDSGTVKAAKFALSGSVPVVGSILSGATDAVLSGAVILKNTLGIFGMLCVAAICLVPFLRVGISYLIFKAGSALLSPICPVQLNGLLDGITSSIGLILGMLGSCSALLFFELVYSVVMTT